MYEIRLYNNGLDDKHAALFRFNAERDSDAVAILYLLSGCACERVALFRVVGDTVYFIHSFNNQRAA